VRDGLITRITLMSAGSHTEPGGYTGAGKENCTIPSVDGSSNWRQRVGNAGADRRGPANSTSPTTSPRSP